MRNEEELLFQLFESFPYPIQVYAPDGTSEYLNPAMMTPFHAPDPSEVVGKYNVLEDPSVIAMGQLPALKRAFGGETVYFQDVRVPLEDISERYGIRDLDVEAVYQDITVFPILDDSKRVVHVAAFLINRRVYRGGDAIERAKEFIENHWFERYDPDETARVACLSKAHFTKLFKKHTGITPNEYHLNCKIGKLKERLLDTNLSIAQAFAACNMVYSGHSAKVFREKTGLSPSAYRAQFTSRKTEGRSVRTRVDDAPKGLAELTQAASERHELFSELFESFPYPIQVFSPDGTARLINKACLDLIGIKSRESHVGTYNAFEDPIVHDLGVMDQLKQVLEGKTVYLTDFNASYQDMIHYFGVEDRDIQTISSDITCFPLLNAEGKVEYFAAVFVFKKVYRGKDEIGRGRQYIEEHWREPFDAEATAKAACLSKSHFTRLFRRHLGLTPHQYYVDYKIKRLKEKLLDTSLSIAEAFAACNLDYNSHSSRLFREKVGVTPSEYREKAGVR